MEDWAGIRRLHRAEGMPIRAIARRMHVSKNTVKKALAAHEPPRYQRAAKGSAVDAFEPQIRALLSEFPDMPTTVIMERIGWQRGKTVFFERVQQLRPLFTPPDPASRTEYQAGELAQRDLWFPPADVPSGFGTRNRSRAWPLPQAKSYDGMGMGGSDGDRCGSGDRCLLHVAQRPSGTQAGGMDGSAR
ncbi:helix-turn-helix domain-containing protein [Nocardia iowensis]|uniref:Helix-turn-helix domain-containing protein n=1 Tax=Nocardia iowensis TaxID=204891 RepID=A0ABX8RXU2_NOCIO|nr:helix-turn-helix domain-containing protein [Nocardia iowensis]